MRHRNEQSRNYRGVDNQQQGGRREFGDQYQQRQFGNTQYGGYENHGGGQQGGWGGDQQRGYEREFRGRGYAYDDDPEGQSQGYRSSGPFQGSGPYSGYEGGSQGRSQGSSRDQWSQGGRQGFQAGGVYGNDQDWGGENRHFLGRPDDGQYRGDSSAHGLGGRQHHDPDYAQWRQQQMQALDDDYENWRKERYQKFSDEFGEWRKNRTTTGGENKASTGTGESSTSNKQRS